MHRSGILAAIYGTTPATYSDSEAGLAALAAALAATRSVPHSMARSVTESMAYSSMTAFSAADSAAESVTLRIFLPFVKAFESGLSLYWITESEIVCSLMPFLKANNNALHCENGPAVFWPDGKENYYFINGIRMKENHVMLPAEKIDPKEVLQETNTNVRRELIRKVGIERMLSVFPNREIDAVGDYQLLSIDFDSRIRNCKYLKMINQSIKVFHLEGVGRECKSVQDALNWRKEHAFGDKEDWKPSQLT